MFKKFSGEGARICFERVSGMSTQPAAGATIPELAARVILNFLKIYRHIFINLQASLYGQHFFFF